MRYEIKYVYPDNYADFLARDVLSLPGIFSEIYYERQVNNVYYDTPALTDYFDARNGIPRRSKTRVRWYGELGEIKNPTLERKLKKGFAGAKSSASLAEYRLGENIAALKEISQDGYMVPGLFEVANRIPTLVNTYKRRYFATPDDLCRITVDYDLRYYSLTSVETGFGISGERTVLEVKFEQEDLPLASELMQALGRHIGKNSKYVHGVSWVLFGRAAE
jgi:SPX domain protein involved in polyphosphate accumulation